MPPAVYAGIPLSVALTVGAASVGIFYLFRSQSHTPKDEVQVRRSTLRAVVPGSSLRPAEAVPYPLKPLPGARDVDTPYGSIRIYEWGPKKGRKVLLVHGISTPCLSLARVAQKLVDRGCRVMLFDLFGRGYSDAPIDIPYDLRLYTTQILLAITSSPISWTTGGGFVLVGYSLGGGIGVNFAVSLPHLVSDLVLLAPGGILRPTHVTWRSWLLYASGLLPERLVEWLVWRRLRGDPGSVPGRRSSGTRQSETAAPRGDAETAAAAEAGAEKLDQARLKDVTPAEPLLVPDCPNSTASEVVAWQVRHHPGFVPAFISSIRYAPIHHQHEAWRMLGNRLRQQRTLYQRDLLHDADGDESDAEEAKRLGLNAGKVLIVLGRDDPIVIPHEVSTDAREVLGEDGARIVTLDAGHELPISSAEEVVQIISEHLNLHHEDSRGQS